MGERAICTQYKRILSIPSGPPDGDMSWTSGICEVVAFTKSDTDTISVDMGGCLISSGFSAELGGPRSEVTTEGSEQI